jgi:hypothetical protein
MPIASCGSPCVRPQHNRLAKRAEILFRGSDKVVRFRAQFAAAAVPFLPLRHIAQQFAGAALSAHPDLGRFGDQRRVFGLLRVGLHRDGLVADAFDAVAAMRCGQGGLGSVIADQSGAAAQAGQLGK